ncbi:MAG: hypothetical protein ABJB86_12470 [Bacteroidota bacterium]
MKEVNGHTISPAFPGGNTYLPLHDFYTALKLNNFLVTPQQITDANRIISAYAGTVKNEQELCNYLVPVFANSLEEQVQFRQIFDEFFTEKEIPLAATLKKRIEKNHIKKHGWKYIIALLIVIAGIIAIKNQGPELPSKPEISFSYHLSNPDTTRKGGTVSPATRIRADVSLILKDSLRLTLQKQKINWGDGSAPDTATSHTYTAEGSYIIIAYANVYYKNKLYYADTIPAQDPVLICFNPAAITIQSFPRDSVKIGENIQLRALINGRQPDSIYWTNQDPSQPGEGRTNNFVTSFNKEGVQTFTCKAFYGDENAPCNTETQISFTVYDPQQKPTVLFRPSLNAKPLQLHFRVYASWFCIAAALTFIFLLLTVFFYRRWRSNKNKKQYNAQQNQQQFDELIRSFSGKTGTPDIPLQNKNYLPLPEQELSIVARMMRLRISDEAMYMNVGKTITKATLNAGFFNPVMLSRTQQSEFLVLIEEKNTNNQQVELFDFLLELLKKQNVYINTFYYRTEPAICYNATGTDEISLEKLSEKFPDNILLLFGDAYQLIYPYYPIIDQQYMQILNRWKHKAVMTPVSFADWGNKEKKVLLEELPVFPADTRGLLLLMRKLFGGEINILFELQQFSDDFYDTDIIDFEDIDELNEYCANAEWANVSRTKIGYSNILFQWIAALAVYPRIKWELTIAIGKAILDQYGYPQQLNYTTLLRMVRISWMKAGQFPDFTRLELLKHLTVENEIIARETILAVLNEIPETDLNTDHFAFEEKETQRIINEFNLYACDPVKYATYKNAKDLFAQLNSNNLVMDTTAKAYLENSSSGWQTLINKPIQPGEPLTPPINTTLTDYLAVKPIDPKRDPLTKMYSRAAAFSFVLFIGSLLGLIALTILNASGQHSRFTYRQAFYTPVEFNFTDTAFSKQPGDALLHVDTLQTRLTNLKKSQLLLNINDSIKNVTISKNGRTVFDTSFAINYGAYSIEFAPNIQLADSTNKVSKIVRPNFTNGIWVLHNAIDINNGNWSNSTLKFTSQKDTAGGLILAGSFAWSDKSVLMGTENFGGSYLDKNRTIKLTGLNFTNVTKAGKDGLTLGTYSAVLSQDENKLSQGTFGSADGRQIAKLLGRWNASRESSLTTPINPLITIQISGDGLVTSANGFKKVLESSGYKVNPVEIKTYHYNSDIYYYNDALQDAAAAIQRIYNQYYPALKVKAHVKDTSKLGANGNAIIIWINQLQAAAINGLTVKYISYQGRGSINAGVLVKGSFSVNPITGLWEEKNNDPQNKGVAKKLILTSRDVNSLGFTTAGKNRILIDITKKKVLVNDEEFYDITNMSDQPLSASPDRKR